MTGWEFTPGTTGISETNNESTQVWFDQQNYFLSHIHFLSNSIRRVKIQIFDFRLQLLMDNLLKIYWCNSIKEREH